MQPDFSQFKSRLDRAVKDGTRRVPGPQADHHDIEAALRADGLLEPMPMIEDVFRINGKTHVVEDCRKGSQDPSFKLIDDAYEIAAPDKAWFVISI